MRRLYLLVTLAACSPSAQVVDAADGATSIAPDGSSKVEDLDASPETGTTADGGPDLDAGSDVKVCSVSYGPSLTTVSDGFSYSDTLPACDAACGAAGPYKYEVTDAANRPDILNCSEELDTAGNRTTRRYCCDRLVCTRLPALDSLCAQHYTMPFGYYCDGPKNEAPPTHRSNCVIYFGPQNDAGGEYYRQRCCPSTQ